MTVLLPNIKVKIMLYEPFLLNMVYKPTERFRNLSLEKYGLLKWKMCRNPVIHLKIYIFFHCCFFLLSTHVKIEYSFLQYKLFFQSSSFLTLSNVSQICYPIIHKNTLFCEITIIVNTLMTSKKRSNVSCDFLPVISYV